MGLAMALNRRVVRHSAAIQRGAATDGARAPTGHTGLVESPEGMADETSSAEAPEVITVEELAHLLRIARGSAYRAVAAGEVPGVVRVGKTLRIHRATVLRWLEQGCAPLKTGRNR